MNGGSAYAPAERNPPALHPLLAVLLITALVFGLALLWLEARHRLRPASPLQLRTGAGRCSASAIRS